MSVEIEGLPLETEQVSEVSFAEAQRAYNKRREATPTEEPKSVAEPPKDAETAKPVGVKEGQNAGDVAPSDDEDEDENTDGKPKRKGGWARKAEKLERQLAELQQQLSKPQEPAAKQTLEAKPEPKGKPSPNDFTGPDALEQYVEAVADWKAEQRELKAREEAAKEAAKKAQTDAATKIKQQLDAGTEKFGEDFEDQANAFFDALPEQVRNVVGHLTINSESGHELVHLLASDKAHLTALSKLHPVAAAAYVGRIESRLEANNSGQAAEAKPEPTTKAPKPPSTVTRGTPAAKAFDPNDAKLAEELTAEEWARKRNAELRQRGRR